MSSFRRIGDSTDVHRLHPLGIPVDVEITAQLEKVAKLVAKILLLEAPEATAHIAVSEHMALALHLHLAKRTQLAPHVSQNDLHSRRRHDLRVRQQ